MCVCLAYQHSSKKLYKALGMVHLHVVLCSNALIQSIFALEYVRFSLLVLSKKRLSMFCESDSFCE